jgi:hypothetical protein
MSRFRFPRSILVLSCLAALTFALPTAAAAQGPGVRAGGSVDPDQFYVGGHYESSPLIDRLYFRPNAEIGWGDDVTTVGFNFEFIYKVPLSREWSLYGGGGPAINVYSFDEDTDADGGLNFLFGVETFRGLFFEMKIGAIDSPDLKFGVGYTFK